MTNNGDGTYRVDMTPLTEGAHHIVVEYEGIELKESPVTVYARDGCDPSRCRIYDEDVTAVTNIASTFVVSTKVGA